MRGMHSSAIRDLLRRFASGHRGRPLEIVSYDVSGHHNAKAVAVAHYVFGRRERVRSNGATKEYAYSGLIDRPGVVWLGQSVFLLTPERARELREFLSRKGVSYGRLGVRVE